MKISLITINRNNAEGLVRTLASIKKQLPSLGARHTLEHIVVDGESTDGSLLKQVSELESQVISLPPNGIYNAINHGLEVATGDILGLLHSGDVFESDDILALVADTMEANDAPDYVFGHIRIGRRLYKGEPLTRHGIITGYAPPHPTLYISRKVFRQIGKYDERLKIAADFDYFVRLYLNEDFKSATLDRIMVRMESGGMSQKWSNRLWYNNSERLTSLRAHKLPASRLRLMIKYVKAIKGFLCSSKKK